MFNIIIRINQIYIPTYLKSLSFKFMKRYKVAVVIEKDEDGYFAFSPELQGCYTQGDNYVEVLEYIKDVIRLHLEDRIEGNEDIVKIESISLTSLEVKRYE